MKDRIVTFETAKLAAEKGFNYFDDSSMYNKDGEYLTYPDYTEEHISAPTQSVLQKWLREEHGIYVTVFPTDLFNKKVVFMYNVHMMLHNRYFHESSGISRMVDDLTDEIWKIHLDNTIPDKVFNRLYDKLILERELAYEVYEDALEKALMAGLNDIDNE